MKASYLGNFIKIYFWKAISVFLNLLSMFIVVPRITSEPIVYGVYMVCISMAIFLSYADIGFIAAGNKYSAECFARKDLKVLVGRIDGAAKRAVAAGSGHLVQSCLHAGFGISGQSKHGDGIVTRNRGVVAE